MYSSSALSQSKPPAPAATPAPDGIQDIVVTARRREEAAQSVPVAITALSPNFLQARGVKGLTDLNSYVPALRVNQFNSPVQLAVALRGQRQAQVIPGQDPSVGFYVGDVNWGYSVGVGQQMYDLSSVQVLKGPQGTLFGRNTTGGAMLIIPAKPTDKFEAEAGAGADFFGHGHGWRTEGIINLPVSDVLQIRGAFNLVRREGYIVNRAPAGVAQPERDPLSSGQRLDGDDSFNMRLSAVLKPTDTIESYFTYAHTRFRNDGTAWHLTALNPASFAAFAAPIAAQVMQDNRHDFYSTSQDTLGLSSLKVDAVANTTSFEIGNVTLKNILGYRHLVNKTVFDIDGLPLAILSAPQEVSGHEFSEEFQILAKLLNDRMDLAAGVYYADQNLFTVSGSEVFGGPPDAATGPSIARTFSVYAQASTKLPVLDDRLSLTTGVRYTRDKREMTIDKTLIFEPGPCLLTENDGVTPLPAPCELSGKKTFSAPTYTISLDFHADPDTLIYAATRRGFRAGGFNENATSPLTFIPFRPETVTDYEVGLKKTWHFGGVELRTNLAAYYQDYKDIQRFVVPPDAPNPSIFSIINAAGAHIPGGEAEIIFLPTRHLRFTGSLAVVKPRYTDFTTPTGDFKNNRFAGVPETQFSLGFNYTVFQSPEHGELSFGADYYHQSSFAYVDTSQAATDGPKDTLGQKAYGLINLQAGWKNFGGSGFDVSAYVKNLLQKHYYTNGILLYATLGTNVATIGQPRVIGVDLSYRF